jgi:hypothetical protein
MKQTMDWIGGIAAQNKYVGGNGLPFSDAKVVTKSSSGLMVSNGPFGDIKETIGGYILVKADSVEEAVEFAKGSPVLHREQRGRRRKCALERPCVDRRSAAWPFHVR